MTEELLKQRKEMLVQLVHDKTYVPMKLKELAMLLSVQAVGNDMQYSIPGGSCMASPSLFVGSLSIAGN